MCMARRQICPTVRSLAAIKRKRQNPSRRMSSIILESTILRGQGPYFEEINKDDDWSDALKRDDFDAQLKLLEAGEIDYSMGNVT